MLLLLQYCIFLFIFPLHAFRSQDIWSVLNGENQGKGLFINLYFGSKQSSVCSLCGTVLCSTINIRRWHLANILGPGHTLVALQSSYGEMWITVSVDIACRMS